jgi:hypothetical protein
MNIPNINNLRRKAKAKPHYMVRTPTNGIHYDVPTLEQAIKEAKDVLDHSNPGAEVRIYQLVRTIRYPRTVEEIDEFQVENT